MWLWLKSNIDIGFCHFKWNLINCIALHVYKYRAAIIKQSFKCISKIENLNWKLARATECNSIAQTELQLYRVQWNSNCKQHTHNSHGKKGEKSTREEKDKKCDSHQWYRALFYSNIMRRFDKSKTMWKGFVFWFVLWSVMEIDSDSE